MQKNRAEKELLRDLRILNKAMEVLQKRQGKSFRPEKDCPTLYGPVAKLIKNIFW